MGDWLLDRLFWVLGVATVACVALLIWGTVADQRKWERFAAAHHCRKVAQVEAGTRVGYAFTGKGGGVAVMPEPGKSAYLCDDGITYWRSE